MDNARALLASASPRSLASTGYLSASVELRLDPIATAPITAGWVGRVGVSASGLDPVEVLVFLEDELGAPSLEVLPALWPVRLPEPAVQDLAGARVERVVDEDTIALDPGGWS